MDPNLQLLVMIEEALALADDLGQPTTAIHLDKARVSAGGDGGLDPSWMDQFEMALA